jgi:hypothetical protein
MNTKKLLEQRLGIPLEVLAKFCQTKKIVELSLFGSALREDFNEESDIDLLVKFSPDYPISLLGMIRLENEIKQLLNRDVDLVSKNSIESSKNWIRRQNILDNAQVIYVQ